MLVNATELTYLKALEERRKKKNVWVTPSCQRRGD